MKAESRDSDLFQALVLFQVKAVAFVTVPKDKDEREGRAKALIQALEAISVLGFEQFGAKLMEVAAYGCDPGEVLCHGVCQPEDNCHYGYALESASNRPVPVDKRTGD
jgi:hypothetical protein